MSTPLDSKLVSYLSDVHALEQVSLRLLEEGGQLDGDSAAAVIYRDHAMQTRHHLRLIDERLTAYQAPCPERTDGRVQVAALTIVLEPGEHRTAAQLAITAYTLENMEIGIYHVLGALARHLHDEETEAVVARILEEEEDAAELVAGAIERASVL